MFASHDPHAFLGLHPKEGGGQVIRLWRPRAEEVHLQVQGVVKTASKRQDGVFELIVPDFVTKDDYKIYHTNGLLAHDPYVFSPLFGEIDAYLFAKGVHYRLYEVLGARCVEHEGCKGVCFAVWAPSALSVCLVGDFNGWDSWMNPMRSLGSSGIWELFVPGLRPQERYKFAIQTKEGVQLLKIDPLAFYSEMRPSNASVVFSLDEYEWHDAKWMEERREKGIGQPINVYEVHLGSWKGQGFRNYREIAHELADYVEKMGFTHVEFLPLSEHPLDESWGYQVSGFYAVTSRYGSPSDFQYLVDLLHQRGIGVLLDWVAAHFPMDDFSLAAFDGSALYEHVDPRQGVHPHWHTYIFNYGRFEVTNFLLASALFWLDKMHIDGLRVDAVASMLYLDYGRREGEWVPNRYGGKENLEAIEFLKHLNAVVQEQFPGALMVAEESTAFPGVTYPLSLGGLGFTLKWNMGWMHDTLRYFKTDPFFRHYEHDLLTFGLLYAFSERFMLAFSHDEVVHCKHSLLSKMPGDDWQKFANLRLLYSYMMSQPGKKLLFMGGEIAERGEWNCKGELDWSFVDDPLRLGMQTMVKELNALYKQHPAFWERDCDSEGFSWVDCADRTNSVLSYLRRGKEEILLCVHHFTPTYLPTYTLFMPGLLSAKEIFSSDRQEYGGSGKVNKEPLVQEEGVLSFSLAPLATMIFSVQME